jgi:hypothetical protein
MAERNAADDSLANDDDHRVDPGRMRPLTMTEIRGTHGGIAGIRNEQLNNKYPECIRGC